MIFEAGRMKEVMSRWIQQDKIVEIQTARCRLENLEPKPEKDNLAYTPVNYQLSRVE